MGMVHNLFQLAVIKLCDDSAGCDEVGDYFASEADTTMIHIVCEVGVNKN